jgi:hypothetical protein
VPASESWPLLSPKPLRDYSPQEYKAYIESLYIEPPKKIPPAEVRISLNKKGSIVLRITRSPKFVLAAEVPILAREVGLTQQALWMILRKKKIELKLPERKK